MSCSPLKQRKFTHYRKESKDIRDSSEDDDDYLEKSQSSDTSQSYEYYVNSSQSSNNSSKHETSDYYGEVKKVNRTTPTSFKTKIGFEKIIEEELNEQKSKKSIPTEKDKKEDDNGKLIYYIFAAIAVIILAIFGYSLIPNKNKVLINEINEDILEKWIEEIYSLENHFPQQSETFWTTVATGIKDLYSSEPKQPCILLLLINNTAESTSECIAKKIANTVVDHIGTSNNGKQYIIDSSEVIGNTYSDALVYLRDIMEQRKALVIKNLQNLSGNLAQSLHVLCDRINPAVPEALVVFTMKVDNTLLQQVDDMKYASIAQQTLTKLWKDHIPEDKLPALLTRITPSVVVIQHENKLPRGC